MLAMNDTENADPQYLGILEKAKIALDNLSG